MILIAVFELSSSRISVFNVYYGSTEQCFIINQDRKKTLKKVRCRCRCRCRCATGRKKIGDIIFRSQATEKRPNKVTFRLSDFCPNGGSPKTIINQNLAKQTPLGNLRLGNMAPVKVVCNVSMGRANMNQATTHSRFNLRLGKYVSSQSGLLGQVGVGKANLSQASTRFT